MRTLSTLLFCVLAAAAAGGGYNVLKTYPVAGDGSWDYLSLDNAARRLYVSHGTQVDVLNADTGEVAGKIAGTKGVHGIALAPALGRGFTSNGGSNNVTIFDLKTLNKVGDVATGKNPDSIIYDPVTRRVFAQNGGSGSSTVIDAAGGKVAGTVELGGAPEFAVSDGKGYIFINLEDKNETLKVNAKELKVEARYPLAPCETPTGLALDLKTRRLFVGCRSKVMAVLNADTGKVVTTLPIGDRVDATVFDAKTGMIYNSNGDGTISVIHEDSADKYSAVETVTTQFGAKTCALDPKTHNLFLSVADFGPAPEGQTKGRPRRPIIPGTFRILVVGK